MDQIKTGSFIASLRKEKDMTQAELAEKIGVTDRAVSKWECGNGFPDVALMLPLCQVLGIDVNELLSGEKISDDLLRKKSEENIMTILEEQKESRKKLTVSILVAVLTVIAFVTIFMVSGLENLDTWLRVVLIVVGTVCMLVGIGVACFLEWDAGTYECKYCGHRFVPSFKSYLMSPHMGFARKFRCPECGKKGYCKKKLTH